VVVVDSANPDFFIAHADVKLILQLPSEPRQPPTELPLFTAMVDRFRTMPKATIAVIEGRCRGGGSALVLGMDLRFAAIGRARLGQPEVAVGIIPGGGGTQRLPRLIGGGRALEVILGCDDVDAETARLVGLGAVERSRWLDCRTLEVPGGQLVCVIPVHSDRDEFLQHARVWP